MHDLLHDLENYICGNLNKYKVYQKVTCHFSFLCEELGSPKRFETLYNANRLHAYLPLYMNSCLHPWLLCSKSTTDVGWVALKTQVIACLSLNGYWDMVELHDTLGSLKHICYLKLSQTRIRNLPVCFIYNLQILKLRDWIFWRFSSWFT